MRTTLTIDDDVMVAVREMAAHQQKSAGKILSNLAREALLPPSMACDERNGIPLLKLRSNAAPVTLDLVKQMQEDLP